MIKKYHIVVSMPLGAILSVLMIISSCANLDKDKNGDLVKKVKGETVQTRNIPNNVDGFGTLSYQKKVDIVSSQDAEISKIVFKEGQAVKSGDIIALLNNPQIILAVERAENALEQSEAALYLSKTQLFDTELQAEANLLSLEKSDAEMEQAWRSYNEEERKQHTQEKLYEAGGLSDETIRQARFELETKFASLKLAEKELDIKRIGFREQDLIAAGIEVPQNKDDKVKAFVNLLTRKARAEIVAASASRDAAEKELKSAVIAKEQLTIRSPITGIIAAKYLEEGEHIKREDKILTIMDSEYLYAVIPVREIESFKLVTGMSANVQIDGTNNTYNGKVDLINPFADSNTYTFSVRVLISKSDLQKKINSDKGNEKIGENNFPKPGMFCRVSINLGQPRSVIALNETAIFNINNEKASVFIINGKTITEKTILLGESFEGMREITKGLNTNEVAVLQPDSDLQDGDYVSIIK
ncbi:MAG: efflux RND transporter periplasmic adaptor subunit [Termitinemataceae bacterium]|nr:MAG: efflux RND transporter periplasmic adaptor subunit [Termitinemataceae bacterium]